MADKNIIYLTRYLYKMISRDSLYVHYQETCDLLTTILELDSICASYIDFFYLINLLSFYDIDDKMSHLIYSLRVKILKESGEIDLTDTENQPMISITHKDFFD